MAYYNPNYNGIQQPYNPSGIWTNPTAGYPSTYPSSNTGGSAWTPQANPQQPQFSIVSIQGRAIAEDYPVAPGAKVMMVDTTEMVAYIKERNAQGALLPFLTYDLVLREDQPKQEAAPVAPTIDYEKIRDIVKEEVDKTFKGKQKNYKEAK